MTMDHAAWLALTTEVPIDPDLSICDPHHHFWDRPNSRYLLEDLLADTGGGHNITETVFLECSAEYSTSGPEEMRPLGEVEFVQSIADESATGNHGPTKVARGIMGRVDLTLGDRATDVLEAHMKISPDRFRGIRHSTAWDPNPNVGGYKSPPQGLMLSSEFREGFARLEPLGLNFDAWLYHPQIPELTDLARAFPKTPIVLDHIGGPIGIDSYEGKRDEVFEDWKLSISELATCSNVFVKLGGLGMPFCGFGWEKRPEPPGSEELAEAMAPYYRHCIEEFGADRCMFESNFPVDKASYSYTVMWNAFKRIAQDFSAEEKAALFRDTAVRFYSLD